MATTRNPDRIIGTKADPQMLRWYIIPRNKWVNIYLHQIVRSDEDRALHDHPWWSLSFMLEGPVVEWTFAYPERGASGGFRQRLILNGEWVFRRGKDAHRLEIVMPQPAWTVFITGPVFRPWGFHCPKGWVDHHDFIKRGEGGLTSETGIGCG
jgi:hypothetical protein